MVFDCQNARILIQHQSLKDLNERPRKKLLICVSEIHSGKIANAIEHYKELNDISKINKIIETSYTDYGKIDNVKNILEFILYLPNINHKIEAVQTLFIQMEQNNHLYSHQGFLFKHAQLAQQTFSSLAQQPRPARISRMEDSGDSTRRPSVSKTRSCRNPGVDFPFL